MKSLTIVIIVFALVLIIGGILIYIKLSGDKSKIRGSIDKSIPTINQTKPVPSYTTDPINIPINKPVPSYTPAPVTNIPSTINKPVPSYTPAPVTNIPSTINKPVPSYTPAPVTNISPIPKLSSYIKSALFKCKSGSGTGTDVKNWLGNLIDSQTEVLDYSKFLCTDKSKCNNLTSPNYPGNWQVWGDSLFSIILQLPKDQQNMFNVVDKTVCKNSYPISITITGTNGKVFKWVWGQYLDLSTILPKPDASSISNPPVSKTAPVSEGSVPSGYYLQRDNNKKYNLYISGVSVKPGLGPGCVDDLTGSFAYRSEAGANETGTVSCSPASVSGGLSKYTCVDSNGSEMIDCCGVYKPTNTGETRRLLTKTQAGATNRTKTVVNTSGSMMSCDEPAPAVVVDVQQDYICKSDKKCHGVNRGGDGILPNSFQPAITDNDGLGNNGIYSGSPENDPCGGQCDLTQTTMRSYRPTRSGGATNGHIPGNITDYDPWVFAGDINVCNLVKNNGGCNTVIQPALAELGKSSNNINNLVDDNCDTNNSCNYRGSNYDPPFVCNLIGLTGVPGLKTKVYGVPKNYNNWGGSDWCRDTTDEGLEIGGDDGTGNKGSYGFKSASMACSVKAELTSKNPDACGGGTPTSYVGCYGDGPSRAIPGGYTTIQGPVYKGCIDQARALGHTMMGIQNGNQCFTGNDLNIATTMYGKVKYNRKPAICTNSDGNMVGGGYTNAIYRIGDVVKSTGKVVKN